MEKPLKVRLHIVSPVHIGCDDVYEPTSFVIDEEKGKLIEFDPVDFIKMLSRQDREEFSRKCMGDDLLGIFKFIKNKYHVNGGKEVEINKSLSDQYKKVLQLNTFNKNVVINQFTINKTAYNLHTRLSYIPGTSLKGAMRTSYLAYLSKRYNISKCWEGYLQEKERGSERDIYYWIGKKNVAKILEEYLLGGSFDADPFRMVKVSDLMAVENVETKIVYAINKKKKKSERPTRADSGPPQILEVIQQGAVFGGILNIRHPLPESTIKGPITETNFLNSINDFYKKILDDEKNVAREIGVSHIDISRFKQDLGKSAFLICIGRHSGAEAVTIEENRHIKIMQSKGEQDKYLDHATTIWLASDTNKPTSNNELAPFGWAVLELLALDTKDIYPLHTITEKAVMSKKEISVLKPDVKPASPSPVPQTTLWGNASLTWNPGNTTLIATKDCRKAELKLAGSRDIVPEPLCKKLFEKKKSVTANVTVEAIGNLFKIIKIEVS